MRRSDQSACYGAYISGFEFIIFLTLREADNLLLCISDCGGTA
jgi:hypothetical protein